MSTALVLANKSQVAQFRAEQQAGRNSGNFALTTAAGLRLAVASGKPEAVASYLLGEMGISATVRASAAGIAIATASQHSFAAIHRALRGAYKVATVMTEDGRTALQILA